MENQEQLLKSLITRNKELKPIVFKSFKTEKELDDYSRKIEKEINEYYENQEKIQQLEYELKSPEEREKYNEYRRLSKLKAQGKFPI